jgi:DNA-binding transcriptional MerR regulator
VSEYRIDDLARLAGATTRTIRDYQQRGLLAYPRLVGRTGWYSEEHLTRARLIVQLTGQGYGLSGVRQMLDTWEKGGDLNDLVPAEQVLSKPWTAEISERTTLTELRRQFGNWITPASIKRAIALGLLEREGTGFRVPNPSIIAAGAQMIGLGLTLPAVLDMAEGMLQDTKSIAARIVDPIRDALVPDGTLPPPEELAAVIAQIDATRPLAMRSTEAFLARAMQDALAKAFGDTLAHSTAAAGRPDDGKAGPAEKVSRRKSRKRGLPVAAPGEGTSA